MSSERLFLKAGTKVGAAAQKYQEQVMGLVRGHQEVITPHMKFDKLNPYGLRKGAATYAVSGTTAAPSVPSIARRGEWSIGSVLDCYWHFGSVGDQYLGRILAGFNPNKQDFGTLPPHWTLIDPLSNELVVEAMDLMYGPILESYPPTSREKPIGLLLRCLASVVYHSPTLIATMVEHPGHSFGKLPVLHNRELLGRLQLLVTIAPTIGKKKKNFF